MALKRFLASFQRLRIPNSSSNHYVKFWNQGNQPFKFYSTATDASKKMTELLRSKFPKAKEIEVIDISHGCGAMYDINVQSIEFKGLSIVKQHRLINEILKDHIKDMHGLRIQTSVPSENG